MPGYREHVMLSAELQDIVIADIALTIAFAFLYSGGIVGLHNISGFISFIPVAFIAVTLSFVLHEYMHKVVAQKFGAIAAFKRWDSGILITLVSSMFGFLIGLPGATMIYTNNFTRREEGYVSLAGPLTNFAVFLVFLGIALLGGPFASSRYMNEIISATLFISVWLAFFNMLPIYPLDGSKVLRWNKTVYVITMLVIFSFLYLVAGTETLYYIAFALVITLIFSFAYRGLRFF